MAFGVDRYPDPPEPRTWHYEYDRVDGEVVRTRIDDFDDDGNTIKEEEDGQEDYRQR